MLTVFQNGFLLVLIGISSLYCLLFNVAKLLKDSLHGMLKLVQNEISETLSSSTIYTWGKSKKIKGLSVNLRDSNV